MQLTRHTDYALRVLMLLGLCPERRITIEEIAQRYGISHNHLMKIVQRLSADGYVEAVRGRGGGLRLARPADQISLGAVVRDFEVGMNLADCFAPQPSGGCPIESCCKLQPVLREALQAFLAVLASYTLADILGCPDTRTTMLERLEVPGVADAADAAGSARN
jgi:Rrf2 family nitric oxide-sensitive transcriptional repressor